MPRQEKSPGNADIYRCHLEWGLPGMRRAARRQDIIVVVDILSFSSAAATAIENNGIVYPCPMTTDVAVLAKSIDGEAAVARRDVPARGRFSLSPPTFKNIEAGQQVVVASPNGAACADSARDGSAVFIGSFLNGEAVAGEISKLLDNSNKMVTVIACGEREKDSGPSDCFRPAIEDYLGAGSIISALDCSLSPEAEVCRQTFGQCHTSLNDILWDCESGLELREMGFGADIRFCSRMNIYKSVPVLCDGRIIRRDL